MNQNEWKTFDGIDDVIPRCDEDLFARSFMQYKLIAKNSQYHYIDLVDGERGSLRLFGISVKGRFSSEMRISTNAPGSERLAGHWDWLMRRSAEKKIQALALEILDRTKVEVPRLDKEVFRNSATTYVVDLQKDSKYATNHRRNLNKALKNKTQLVERPREEAIEAHIHVWQESMSRRSQRGEEISESMTPDRVRRYLNGGIGRLYQCAVEDEVVSSDLVISVGPHAFYDSGGSSQLGMTTGSSYLLMDAIIRDLKSRNAVSLNLGVTTPDRTGLIRFKRGWGAEEIEYATARFEIFRPWKERVVGLFRNMRNP